MLAQVRNVNSQFRVLYADDKSCVSIAIAQERRQSFVGIRLWNGVAVVVIEVVAIERESKLELCLCQNASYVYKYNCFSIWHYIRHIYKATIQFTALYI